MKKYKEIDKKLPREHGDIAFSVVNQVRKKGFNRYEFNHIREKIYLEAEKLFDEQVPPGDYYRKRLEQVATKMSMKALPKGKLEILGNILFIVFTIFSVSFPIIYGINFAQKTTSGIYSRGIYFYISLISLFYTTLYLTLGVVVATSLQNLERRKKWVLIGSILAVAVVVLIVLYALSENFPDFRFKINFIVLEVTSLLLAIGGFFLENQLSKKSFKNKHASK